jgi:hypothetical protein
LLGGGAAGQRFELVAELREHPAQRLEQHPADGRLVDPEQLRDPVHRVGLVEGGVEQVNHFVAMRVNDQSGRCQAGIDLWQLPLSFVPVNIHDRSTALRVNWSRPTRARAGRRPSKVLPCLSFGLLSLSSM